MTQPARPLVAAAPAAAAPGAPRRVGSAATGVRRTGQQEALALPEIPLEVEADTDASAFEKVNAVQVRYQPMSAVNPTGAVIPASMAASTRAALETLRGRVGDIDEWLCQRLRWSREELGRYLTSEQADAVALALDSADRGEGLIIADQTGFGKGRIIAAVARGRILDGVPVIFMTEKANLFSDFWRDVRDIGSEDVFGKPFMLNDGARLVDTSTEEGRVLVPAWKKAEVDRTIKSARLPEGCRWMMATYSQFNRKGTRKSAFLEQVAPGSHIVLDEAHNFVGDSTTSKTVGGALEAAASSTFSSATFARDVGNLAAYSSVFPWLRRIRGLEEFTPAQKRALAEESTRLATASGRIIRREHDLSNMVLKVVEDEKRQARNEELADRLAPILSGMAKLARKVDKLLEERNENNAEQLETLASDAERKAARELWFTANFGSRLNAAVGQFLVALSVDACVDECIASLKAGEKPVVVIETTMESLMRELAKEASEKEAEADGDEEPVLPGLDGDAETESVDAAARPPTFRDALAIMTDRLLKVSVRRGVEYEKEEVKLEDPELLAMQRKVAEMVATFPDISLSPIDDIRDRVEAEGRRLYAANEIEKPWVADEISARSMRVVDGRYEKMPNVDRNQAVARFVNGGSQCLVITRAASTGLSIHDSDKFTDHKRRHMIELRPPRNVVERIQTWGRVFRRGQRTEPRFSTLSTGLPFQVYDLAMQNRKVEELCASVTGSGASMTTMSVPDPIDAVGNDVAHDFLMENQALADHMGIPMNVDRAEADKEFYFVSKLLRRLPLLGRDLQRQVFQSFMAAYEDRMKGGAAIHAGCDLEGAWTAVKREILEAGDGSLDPVNGRDLWVTTIRSVRKATPMRSDEARAMVAASGARLGQAPFVAHVAEITARAPDLLKAALPGNRYRSVEHALRVSEDNSVKRADQKLKNAAYLLKQLAPGVAARLLNEDGEPADAIVLDIHAPPLERAAVPREYELTYILHGDEKPRTISLDALVRDPRLQLSDRARGDRLLAALDSAPSGDVAVERKVLDGNGIAAVLASRRMGFGTRTSYLDDAGRLRTGILVPRSMERKLAGQPGRTSLPDVAAAVFAAGGRIQTDPIRPAEGVEIRADGRGGAIVVVPYAKRAAKPFETPGLLILTGPFDGGDWRGREAKVPAARVPAVLRQLARQGSDFHFEARFRRLAVETTRKVAQERPLEPEQAEQALEALRCG